ncbi:transmembrane protein, putative [Rhizoctonia solani AG-3 Rhs1AP]|uniref:Transmembrane protein, putative n=1 Tax=Rhizoctonia solani AG-3 Rhs1AP TaxID=1086054 RepID=X8IYL1_9AGAM|nr:transmembrane protein, putative [Rhizoctonia solani AG-3 Rhs1AP]
MTVRKSLCFKWPTLETSWLCWSLWVGICVLALGFPNKYLERLVYFEDLIPNPNIRAWSQRKSFSDRGDSSGLKTMRQKQQEEWDRLNIAMSVITATSATTLAIQATGPDPTNVYWVVTAFYSAAFGMSLQGLIINTYMTISAGSSSDEAIGRLTKGELFPGQPVRPVAFIMALPAILATYSSFALLGGLVAMIMHGPGESAAVHAGEYIAVAIIPVTITFLCLLLTVVLCEAGTCIERRERAKEAQETQQVENSSMHLVSQSEVHSSSAMSFPTPI